jgi:hypothetical protein
LDALPDRATPCDPECGFLGRPGPGAAATGVEIPDGLRLTLPAERFTALAGLAAAARECRPFFDFRFHLDGRDLHFEVRAPAEGAGLLAEVFAVG